MAREHARIWLDINSDDEFESLPFDAQGFYTRVILTLDDLSYAGVADWRPRKLTTKAPDLTYPRILAAAAELEVGRYCLFDLDTEEVLARSFIRRDELLRNPTMAAAVVKAYGGIASKVLRAAVVTEVRRVRDEHPEYSSWSASIKGYDVGEALSKLLAKPGLDEVPYTPQIQVPIGNPAPVPNTNPEPVSIGNSQPVRNTDTSTNTKSVGNPCTYTSTLTPAPSEGYVSTEGHQGAEPDPNSPPPRYCPKHMPNGTDDKCPACGDHRRAFDTWMANASLDEKRAQQERAQAEAAERVSAAAARAMAIAECELCDDDGYRGTTVCDHQEHADTNARGMAMVRAAMAKGDDQ